MSSKINIKEIISGHIDTLKDSEGTLINGDRRTFIYFPISFSVILAIFGFNLNSELSSLLVNFGSIITALLLSVLVLVYDQKNKLKNNNEESLTSSEKHALLDELYYNISFSILCAISLVVLCFIHTAATKLTWTFDLGGDEIPISINHIIISPIAIFIATSLVLAIIMIVKRMHTLLTTDT